MPDYRITIDIRNVGPGDVKEFWDTLEESFGPDFDIELGDFDISCSVVEYTNGPTTRFPVGREDLNN